MAVLKLSSSGCAWDCLRYVCWLWCSFTSWFGKSAASERPGLLVNVNSLNCEGSAELEISRAAVPWFAERKLWGDSLLGVAMPWFAERKLWGDSLLGVAVPWFAERKLWGDSLLGEAPSGHSRAELFKDGGRGLLYTRLVLESTDEAEGMEKKEEITLSYQ